MTMIRRRPLLRPLLIAASLMGGLAVDACVGDDPAGNSANDASTSDANAAGDGTTTNDQVSGPCNLAGDFGAPVAVAGLEAVANVARFSQDELTAYVSITPDGGTPQIAEASRSSVSGAFGGPTILSELDVTGAIGGDIHASVTTDGLTLYFSANAWTDGGLGGDDILYARRGNVDASFNTPVDVPGINSPADDEEPYAAASGDLWFVSTRDDDAGNSHLYRALNVGSGLGNPSAVNDVNSVSDTDQYPVVTNDGLTLYFSRRGSDTQQLDVWSATRATASSTFSKPASVPSVNSSDNDRASWISPDGCRLYITRGTVTPGNPFTVLVASKPAN